MAIRLSRLARQDLDEIRRCTIETWGRAQWLTYYRGMVRAFEAIATDPDGGRDRSLFAAGLRLRNYGRHVIFFARIDAASGENHPCVDGIVPASAGMTALGLVKSFPRGLSP